MAEIKLNIPDHLVAELSKRAEKRETSLNDYIYKSLKWHLKQVKKVEAGLAEDAQNYNFMAQATLSAQMESDEESS
ncbi:MAG: hypothetical protein CR997_05705 [Acidobacteria bacterium]|nr:MAG: hypothetical protein CR997_05705 [Acidobacteriota bacterium]